MDVGWFRTALVAWLPVAVVATVLAATSYVTTQQLTRSSVDDAPPPGNGSAGCRHPVARRQTRRRDTWTTRRPGDRPRPVPDGVRPGGRSPGKHRPARRCNAG